MAMRLIIVIDGDQDFLREIGRDLSGLRHRVIALRSGRKGIAMAKTGSPDLILLDMDLVGGGAFALMEELKTDEITKRIPVIMTMQNADRESLVSARKAGAADFLLKPYRKETLLEKMDQVWQGQQDRDKRERHQERESATVLKVTRNGNRVALFVPPEIDQEYISLVAEEYAGGVLQIPENGDLILDLRPLGDLNAPGRKHLFDFLRLFEREEPIVVAGRHYGILLQEGFDEHARLFLSVDELLAYLKYVGRT